MLDKFYDNLENYDNLFLQQIWGNDNCFENSSDSVENFKEGKEYVKTVPVKSADQGVLKNL